MDSQISALILASGLSERMKQPKALLKWDDNTTFIEKLLNDFSKAGCARIVCTINSSVQSFCSGIAVPENVSFALNHYPEKGRLYSVKTGLNVLKDSTFCFIHNVDNPFISAGIIKKLSLNRNPGSWSCPVFMGKAGHPVLLPADIIRKIIKTGDMNSRLDDILKNFPKIQVEVDSDVIFRNINTPEDYSEYFNITD